MPRKQKSPPCAYKGCWRTVVKELHSRHGYGWFYCHFHHVSAAHARMTYKLDIPNTVKKVA